MRIERVSAGAFGPIVRAVMEFAPGLTIVYGPNESGKSSWHAALYVGLCGVRRSRGRGTSEDREFEALHKPWDGTRWEVGSNLRLEDGRRIELHFDLAGRVDCSARDTDLGRDVSNEIMDGTPDASRWLGLDRRSFLATACIQQADLLGVLAAPALLQEHMQRAAATAGTDATAAAAITRLEDFKKERVGADRVHGRRPMRSAKDAFDTAEANVRSARQAHDQFSEVAARADRAAKRADESEHNLRALRASIDSSALAQLEERLSRARELAERYPHGPPPGLVADEALVRRVAAAIQAAEQAPEAIWLTGRTSQDIGRELDALPKVLAGDLEPHNEVIAARDRLQLAEQAIELLGPAPDQPEARPATGLGEQRLLELARDLEVPEPSADPTLADRVRQAQAALDATSRRRDAFAGLLVAGVVAVAAAVLLVTRFIVPGLVGLGIAFAAAAWVLLKRGSRSREELKAVGDLRRAEGALGQDHYRIEQVRSRRAAALAQVADAGAPTTPADLRDAARQLVEAERAQQRLDDWRARHDDAAQAIDAAERDLASALASRGAPVIAELHIAAREYAAACGERAAVAAEAKKRPQLEAALLGRRELESAAADSERIRTAATEMVMAAAAAVGSTTESQETAKAALKEWQSRHAAAVAAAEVAVREWTELEGILSGHSLEELEADVSSRHAAAARDAEELDPAEILGATFAGDGRADLASAQTRARTDRTEADRLAGNVETEAGALPSVAEAEERLAAAKVELERVRRLERTLDQTLTFLRAAQERVHHDIAPVLNETLRHWLPDLTSGRYVDATVDPASLEVRVMTTAGKWRTARYLSQGTREQIYLLLRVALAEHLTEPPEVIPLIFDDVTVQCDAARTVSLLQMMHRVSRDRQVILFSQEEDVLRWARTNLDDSCDKLVQLDPAAIPA
jgi:exonuclease SbcC